MDRLEAMGTFVAVADARGFAPAARRLRVSPSAVTRTIAALEEHLGARLLQRTTRSVTLTDAGTRYLERARRILADVAEAEGAAQAERSAPTGRLVVSAPAVFGRLHVAPALLTFLKRHRAVSGELSLSDRFVNLVEDGVDVAVRIGPLADASYVARPVGATRRVLVGAPRYIGKRKKLRTPEDLAAHDIIHCTAISPVAELRFASETRVPFLPVFVTNGVDVAIRTAEDGGGLVTVFSYQVADAVRAGRLAVVLAEHELPPLPIHVVYPTTRLLSAKVRAFAEHVSATCDWRFVELGSATRSHASALAPSPSSQRTRARSPSSRARR